MSKKTIEELDRALSDFMGRADEKIERLDLVMTKELVKVKEHLADKSIKLDIAEDEILKLQKQVRNSKRIHVITLLILGMNLGMWLLRGL